ncbi:hypothetical protein DIZ76_017416 [Coccidioides immitis]|nr:hypothetical protein DIZ76_017416 [Coccidioides immitis]
MQQPHPAQHALKHVPDHPKTSSIVAPALPPVQYAWIPSIILRTTASPPVYTSGQVTVQPQPEMSLQTKDQPPTEHASTKSPASVRLDQLGSQYVRGSHSADCYFKKRRFFPELLAGLKVKYKWNQRTREMKKLRRCWSFVSVLGAGTSQRL